MNDVAPSAAPAVPAAPAVEPAAPATPVASSVEPAAPATPVASSVEPAAPAAPAAPVEPPKPAEPKPADPKPADTKPIGAPEKYEAFKVPEGAALDETVVSKFSEAAKAANLTQDQAQVFLDTMNPVIAAQQAQAIERVQGEWLEQTKADKEIGGANFDANVAIARKAVETFGSPELKAMLEQTKLGNHPEWVRFAMRAGKAISQDGFIPGQARGSNAGQSLEDRAAAKLYGNA